MKWELFIVMAILLALALVVCGGCVPDEEYAAKKLECERLRNDWNALNPMYESLWVKYQEKQRNYETLIADFWKMVAENAKLIVENKYLLDDVNKTPDPNQLVWGQGDPPSEWQGFFGNDNMARLNFVQTQTLNKQGQIMAELAKRVRKLEELNNAAPDTSKSP